MGTAQNNFRTNIEQLLRLKRTTQSDLAKRAGIHSTQLNRILKGHSDPTLRTAESIARALGTSLTFLASPPDWGQSPNRNALDSEGALENFRTNTKNLAEQQGLSHNQLAKLAKVDPSLVSRILNGHRKPTPKTAKRIAKALGTSLGYLVDPPEETIQPEEIREIRRKLGITQAELASRMHVTRDAVAHWELGRCHPSGPAEILLRKFERSGDE